MRLLDYFDKKPEPNDQLPDYLREMLWSYGNTTTEIEFGVDHGVEIEYVFGFMSSDAGYSYGVSEDDQKIGLSIMNAWATFAATG